VALVRTNVSEEHIAFIIRMERISKLGTTLAVTNKATWPHIPEDKDCSTAKDAEESNYDLIKVLFQNMFEMTDEKHKKTSVWIVGILMKK
jgi:hypothetical protein